MQQSYLEELIIKGDEDAIKSYLITKPTAVTEVTTHGVSLLMLSCYYKKPTISTILIEFLESLNLFEASATGKFDLVAHQIFKNPQFINDFSDDGFTALGLACYFGNEEVARYLVLKGADVNLSSQNGFNVYPIHSSTAGNHTGITKMLIENKANVNVIQQSGLTPLHSAAQNGNVEMIILLIEKGANVDAKMEGGQLPADLAKEKGYKELAAILR